MRIKVVKNETTYEEVDVTFPFYATFDDYDDDTDTDTTWVRRIDADGKVYAITEKYHRGMLEKYEFSICRVNLEDYLGMYLKETSSFAEKDFWDVLERCRDELGGFPIRPAVGDGDA